MPLRTDDSRRGIEPGDDRRLGPTTDELLGQRAGRRPTADVDDAVGTGSVPVPELPDLRADVYLLEPDAEGRRRRREAVLGPFQGLVLDAALSAGGDAVWIDAQGHATTHALAGVAPSTTALDRVHVARAFTTHQHHTLVEAVRRWLSGGTVGPFGVPGTDRPAVLACPAVDALYRTGELRENESRRLLAGALAALRAVAREAEIPVVVTRSRADDYAAPVEAAATTITLTGTAPGARLQCPDLDFETLSYPVGDGLVQTTLSFWAEILAARHPGTAPGTGSSRVRSPATGSDDAPAPATGEDGRSPPTTITPGTLEG